MVYGFKTFLCIHDAYEREREIKWIYLKSFWLDKNVSILVGGGGPSKFECMQTGGEGICVKANLRK